MNHSYTVEFRISSEDLDLNLISTELTLNPTRSYNAGELLLGKKRKNTMWGYNGSEEGKELEWEDLEVGLEYLMDKLWSRRNIIKTFNNKYTVSWWCGHFQSSFDGGPSFSPGLLRRLGEFDVKLYIDCHFVDEDS